MPGCCRPCRDALKTPYFMGFLHVFFAVSVDADSPCGPSAQQRKTTTMATSRRRTFEQQDPTKGNFRAYKNLSSDPENRNPPAFTGRIALPGNAEERSFSLWAATSRSTGNLILSGPVTPTRAQQWAQLSRKEGEQSPDAAKYVTMTGADDIGLPRRRRRPFRPSLGANAAGRTPRRGRLLAGARGLPRLARGPRRRPAR